ncbi:MAG TPA: ATP-binding protein, partial [Armatimonadota bacterium]|nr:ATP-binding protein [Armatimonadota bacterium]
SKRKQLEEELRQSQKMEAIGRLAGGVAHDFNNLLMPILTFGEMLLSRLEDGDPLQHYADQIVRTAERASALPRQLLAFSRRQILQPKVLELDTLITEMEKMLRTLVGEDISFSVQSAPGTGLVKADQVQLEQVLMNLSANARDAMPNGGSLLIETKNVELDAETVRLRPGCKPGRYVMLAVSDTGCGMDRETLAQIFEPFFTTKEKGKGTGLGLATVYGIVKQSGGDIRVYSEVGKGTTFKVYLPRVDAAQEPVAATARDQQPRGGTETILLVEDEDAVRESVRELLDANGYHVLDASNGDAALALCGERQEPIHLLLTDVVMPGMSGNVLAERLRRMRPGIKTLFMSGYTEDAIVHHGVLLDGVSFLQKPFSPRTLASKVREVLDTGTADPAEK